MPLTIKARDSATTKNPEGKTSARIKPAPSMANISPRLPPLDLLLMQTPPLPLLLSLYAASKNVLMVFIRYKYEGCPLFNFDLRLLGCCLIAYAEAAERLKCVILQRISKAAQ